ncbi:MAG: glycosyltransferase family 4 protein [Planctomycetota bacterium]
MKITIACKYFSPRGGAQTFLFNFVRHLLEDDHRVRVITMEVEGEMDGVETQKVPMPPVPKTFRDVTFARRVQKILQKDEHDISFGEQKTWGADVVRPGGGVHEEYLTQVISSYPSAFLRFIQSIRKRISLKERLNLHIERKLYRKHRPLRVIAISHMVRQHLLEYYPGLRGRIPLVYCGVDCDRFVPGHDEEKAAVRRELGVPSDALLCAFCAFDLRRKGIDTTLRALSILKERQRQRPVHLLVIGRDKHWARRLASRVDVSDRVYFTGITEPDRYYRACDLSVLPSYFDPFANVCLESLASGLPLITSSHTGAHELLTPGKDGFYIEDPQDAEALAEHIAHFSDQKVLNNASSAARRLACEYTDDRMFSELMDVIRAALDEKRRRE